MLSAITRDHTFRREEGQGSRLWHGLLYAFLVFVFVTGGSSQERGWTDAISELLSLPILAVAFWRLESCTPSRVRRLGLCAMAAVALLPWLQLLPLSPALWQVPGAREALHADLVKAGVATHASTWSLTPAATFRGALALLPATALFAAVLGVDTRTQRRLLVLCVALPIASLLLGFLQMGAAQDSLLNPYPQWAPAMNGTFANPNHQGTAMLVGLGICLAFSVGAFRSHDEATGRKRNPWPAIIAGGTLLLGLPLTNSRAAVVIGVLLLVAAPLGMAATALRRTGEARRGVIALMLVATLAALGLSAATGWMKVDEIEEFRWLMRQATFSLGFSHLPWGSGIGSFVPVFQQALPEGLLMTTYINAAHNDYSQVWLEAGLAGLVAVALVTAAVFAAIAAHVREHRGDRRLVWAATLGLFVFLAHAGADYALRTPALLAVAALLAGVVLAQAARSR
ncbi:MAG: O-antigen ligase domain-containing protein [Lysobacteraceae bacterium]|nr:MAG: O-antigen ligase domain-containing protein [Xanthomonadaceae bacterium]